MYIKKVAHVIFSVTFSKLYLTTTKSYKTQNEGTPIKIEIFKEKLETYLKDQKVQYKSTFESQALCDCFCEDILDVDVDVKTIGTHPPKRLLFINFNYTNTLEPYVEECRKRIHSDINYIHGSVNDENNPPIFGFGDEFDESYKEFEDKKTICYLNILNLLDILKHKIIII